MSMMNKSNQTAALWWVSIITIAIGIAAFILLEPDYSDYQMERTRSAILVACCIIPGFCIIIGTRRRWFGKGL
jgi:hypothetical protein